MKTLEKKSGKPQATVTAHLDKLANYSSINMNNSDQIINVSVTVSRVVGVFRSLSYDSEFHSSTLLNKAVQKLPLNLKELCSLQTVKSDLIRLEMLDFNERLKKGAQGHDRMKFTSFKNKPISGIFIGAMKTKVPSNVSTQFKAIQL